MKKIINVQESIFYKDVKRGEDAKIISFNEERDRITYNCSRKYSTSFKNPEEAVRASFYTELILNYNYPRDKIDLEVTVPRRTPEDRADIVVYSDDELKSPYIVVECKKDGVSDAEFSQAIEQAFGNANNFGSTEYTMVVAGTTKRFFALKGFPPREREKNIIADIPLKYGKAPKYRFVKGDEDKDLKQVSREDLIRSLEKSHDTVWQGGKLAPTTAFDEVSKLLFCKLKDEKDTLNGQLYQFQIGTYETSEEVFRRIDKIYQKAKKEDAEVFRDDIRLSPKIVFNVVEHLQEIAFVKTDLDTKGVAFERFMEDFFKGKMGQFFTPREVIRFCVEMLEPNKGDLVLDPACGSGGFLLNTLDIVRDFAERNYDDREAYMHWHNFAKDNLYGIEINDQIARVCKMNMIIHDDGHTNVINTDSLDSFKNIEEIHKGFRKDRFDIILTNPPFGAKVKASEKDYLKTFELGKSNEKVRNTQSTEVLFIERCIQFLKPKTGKMAIVLPDGILTNSSMQYVRDFILEKCQLEAVVSLPQYAFSHYGAGVKSSLVFVRKLGEKEKRKNYPIFMAIAEHIGYDATGRKDPKNDLVHILEEYRKFEKQQFSYEGI